MKYKPARLVLILGLVQLTMAGLVDCSGGSGGNPSGTNSEISSACTPPSISASPLTSPLNIARTGHTATLLPNGTVGSNGTVLPNGTVLAAGGFGDTGLLSSAELYDPTTGTWTPTGSLSAARISHTATLLPNGTVLVAWGYRGTGLLDSAELYDPTTGQWTPNGVQAVLVWDPSNAPSTLGYKIYYGTSSRIYDQEIDTGTSSTYAFSSLKSGTTYYFSITAYNFAGESCASNEVSKTMP